MKGSRFGLNTSVRPEDLVPGEATTALNVDFSGGTIRKRSGSRLVFTGGPDNVVKGAAPSSSLYLVGEERWLDHDVAIEEAISGNVTATGDMHTRRDFYNQRQGIIVIPQDDLTSIRLNVRSGDPDWAIEFCTWTDTLPLIRWKDSADTPQTPFSIILGAKGGAGRNQWAVRLIPDSTSVERFHVVLTLYELGVWTAGTDFYYQNGAARAWVEPGKRMWFAWRFTDGGSPTITSYFWIEGQGSVVSSSQAVSSTLRTNGVGTESQPVILGRRGGNFTSDTGGSEMRETGFLGCVSELRFWDDTADNSISLPSNWATVTADPPASTDWYVEREIPEDQLTTDSGVESGNIVQSHDLKAYWQFKPSLIGKGADGTEYADENHRLIRPRYRSNGSTGSKAWLTGADATWVSGGGNKLGNYALSFVPEGPSGQEYEYAEALRDTVGWRYTGYKTFIAGIRVPFSNSYLRHASNTSGSDEQEWPDAMSFRIAFRVDALNAITQTLLCIDSARRGTNPGEYGVNPAIRLFIDSSDKVNFGVVDGSGVETLITSTTSVVEGSEYVVLGTVRWWGSADRKMNLYLDGVQEDTDTSAASSKPWASQTTGSDTTSPNTDGEDGRNGNFPMFIGCSQVTTRSSASPSVFTFRYGSQDNGVTANPPGDRLYWGAHNNETKMTPNSGIGFHGYLPFVGAIGSIQIWHKEVNESEARRYVDRGPNPQEITADGRSLLSSWDMVEGKGTIVHDSGTLKNHLYINPYPTLKVQQGVLWRDEKPTVLSLASRREKEVVDGVNIRETYAVSEGTVHKLSYDGGYYLTPIGRCMTREMWEPENKARTLPTWFEFGNQLFLCPGLGPVKRISNGKLLDAGLTPVFGDIGQDQTHLGWREFDRDGTFLVTRTDAASSGETLFAEDVRYGWAVTFYDPESGVESAPSRLMFFTTSSSGGTDGWKNALLGPLPKSPQKNMTKYRIYRTTQNGSEFKLVDEIDTAIYYLDSKEDSALEFAMDSTLNFPPPMNANLGIAFGARAFYSGVPENPSVVYYSFQGDPGSCPPQYQIDLQEDVMALLPLNDRVLVGTRTRWYALFDTGGDIAVNAPDQPPVQLATLTTEVGCLGHHGCVMVPGVGWIIPTGRGLYTTDGSSFRYLSERVEDYWKTLNFNGGSRFVGISNKKSNQYLLFHNVAADETSENNKVLVWDYGNNAFSIYDSMYVVNAANVEDADNGVERMLLLGNKGHVWEFDPPDATVNADGVSASPYSGTVVSSKKDPLGSGKYTRIRLSSTNVLPTSGNGLRGVVVYFYAANGTAWNSSPCQILWNDGQYITIDATNATTTQLTSSYTWKLGPYKAQWVSGKMNLGAPTFLKKVAKVQLEYGEAGGTTLRAGAKFDEQGEQAFTTVNPSRRFDTVAPIMGRGRSITLSLTDSTATGGETNNLWDVREIEMDFHPKGRSTFIGS